VILEISLTFEGIDRGLMGLALVMAIYIRRCRRCDENIRECGMVYIRPFVGKCEKLFLVHDKEQVFAGAPHGFYDPWKGTHYAQ
jgi:hypothetical protein